MSLTFAISEELDVARLGRHLIRDLSSYYNYQSAADAERREQRGV